MPDPPVITAQVGGGLFYSPHWALPLPSALPPHPKQHSAHTTAPFQDPAHGLELKCVMICPHQTSLVTIPLHAKNKIIIKQKLKRD